MCFFAVKKISKKNSALAFQQFLQKKKESINGEKNELICMLKKIQRKKLVQQF